MKTIRLLPIFLLLSFLTIKSFSQETASFLTGTVTNAGNEVLTGVTVKALHQPSGTVYNTTTDARGGYRLNNLRPGGPYQITFTSVGYENKVINDVFLRLAETQSVTAVLSTTTQTLSEVVVSSTVSNSLLNANRVGAVTNVNTRQLQTLPTISRSLNDFLRLTPQSSSTSTGAVGGGNYRQNYITVDGSDFNNSFGIGTNLPANGSPISLDAVEQISVNVTPYDVKQSGFVGSAVNAVTRSGTNDFSGSVYTFWRSENQQGNRVAYDKFTKQDLSVETYGFRVGGPIIKNKLFFFINAEKGETTTPPSNQNIAATAASGTGSYGSATNIARPTVTELNTFRDYLINTYSYDPGSYQGYNFKSNNTRLVGRLDWNINTNHRLNIRYSQVESESPNPLSTSRSPLSGYPNGAGRTDINALPFSNSNYYQEANFYSLAAELNSKFGNVSNVFRATYTHQNDPRSSDSKIFPFVDILQDGTPLTSFGYEPFTYGNLRDVKALSFVDYATWTKGISNWTVGAQADYQSTKNGFQRFATSYYTFSSWDDFVNGANPRDFAITYSLLPDYAQAYPKFKFAQYSVYGQDELRLSRKFRLTAGLRIDMPTYLDVSEIQTHPLVAALNFANGEKINTGTLPKNRLMWSPRLGFNWDVKGDRSLQVRGGSGIFTGRVPTVWIVAQSGDAGLLQFTQLYTGQENTPGPFNPDPAAYRPAVQPKPGTSIPSSISAIDRNFKFPQSWKSSLALDVRLPWGLTGTLEGIVNKDLNVALGRNPNLVNPTPLNIFGYPDNRPIYPARNTDKFLNPLIGGQAVAPGTTTATGGDAGSFNSIVLDNGSKGYYWSVTARLDKQFSKGLYATLAYVKSQAKNLYDGNGDQLINTWSGTYIVGNPNSPELSYANYVVPDRVVLSLSYRKEYLSHLATSVSLFWEGSVAGRFSYTYSSDFNRDGQTNDLIYVPANPSEIDFAPLTIGSGDNAVTYTPQQQKDIFFRYIEQDKYLSSRKGQYAERNGGKYPWRNQVDVRFAQDLFTNIAKKRNTLQFTLDIFNFGNLLNKNWGLIKTTNAAGILIPANTSSLIADDDVRPQFRLATDRGLPVTTTFRNVINTASTYYMQFGLRYTFN